MWNCLSYDLKILWGSFRLIKRKPYVNGPYGWWSLLVLWTLFFVCAWNALHRINKCCQPYYAFLLVEQLHILLGKYKGPSFSRSFAWLDFIFSLTSLDSRPVRLLRLLHLISILTRRFISLNKKVTNCNRYKVHRKLSQLLHLETRPHALKHDFFWQWSMRASRPKFFNWPTKRSLKTNVVSASTTEKQLPLS